MYQVTSLVEGLKISTPKHKTQNKSTPTSKSNNQTPPQYVKTSIFLDTLIIFSRGVTQCHRCHCRPRHVQATWIGQCTIVLLRSMALSALGH